ncbi:MAG: hypothetical protein J7545_19745 [Roseofilum sp. SBFL]|uniref:hypothetical protein n=1 Tax=unclassified Roseofilum TaxID=2620099 RepID=UPI001AFF524C|nr:MULTISPECIES: hypothetical protein [unclassified Roseofilum]MBP0014488.1 hypothetical protein [Roseofilum sp. SID3]MBP0026542.1 hypothetical protein [Roseofilum sp. SID2]MBP0039444.1 hypothetical protein [Roseofilum sp. SID1]MBP0044177.1 hypothetical protein [Roseofilum sp. SBFL]
MDSSVLSRDLAILAYHGDLPDRSLIKAEAAYPVREPLKRAIGITKPYRSKTPPKLEKVWSN